jgi:heme/copper-type cytochrome/quinol oxidase subunit 3
MAQPRDLDVSDLPSYAFGQRSILWWATLGFCLIEATAFALALLGYFYLRSKAPLWPSASAAPPSLLWGTLNTAILLASCIPNALAKRAAEREDIAPVRLWLGIALLFGVAFNIVRALEFTALGIRWDSDAYGSIVWALMALHTTHILTDFLDSVVLWALMLTRHGKGRRFVDVSENAFYWYFVVLTWLPIYATVYLVPRF